MLDLHHHQTHLTPTESVMLKSIELARAATEIKTIHRIICVLLIATSCAACGAVDDSETSVDAPQNDTAVDATTDLSFVPDSDVTSDGDLEAPDTGSEDLRPDLPPIDMAASGAFDQIFEQVLVPYGCTAGYCHGAQAGGLQLNNADGAYAALVGVPAFAPTCDQTMLVVPNAPDESILWVRIRPESLDPPAGCSTKMPKGDDPMSEADANLVRDWIAAGAVR